MEETGIMAAADTTTTTEAEPTAVVAPVPGWLLVTLLAVAALVLWLVTFDNGQLTSVLSRGDLFVHELFHDGRHVVGVPCH
ncbi:MAG TPA: CbtB-domain containing protein [Acidimicrobiales bacterium]|nr:CbtB-domain containing protein [Acidimicrobiales bacterium]